MNNPGKIFRVGTLSYTTRALIALCAILLFGDLCAMVFESIFTPFMPLYLKQFKASNGLISLLTTSTAGLMNLFFLPNLSIWSDRTRTRLGRRIPFLIWAAPCTALSLVLIGFAPDIARWLQHLGLSPSIVSLTSLTLGALTLFVLMWHSFNLVLLNVYNFLLRDVVPLEVMPTFLAAFRFIGYAGHFVFQWFLYQYMLDYPKALFIGLGLLFVLVFWFISWRVKEGEYPEPPAEKPKILKDYLAYFRQGLSLPLYRNFYITHALILLGTAPTTTFLVLFAREDLHLTLATMGKITAWGTAAQAILFLPVGYLCQKFGPFRVALFALVMGVGLRVFGYFFVTGQTSWLFYSVLVMVPTVAWNLGSLSVAMFLFPKEKFGQFFSGLNVLGYGSLMVTGYLVGCFMDAVGSNYRAIFVVSLLCYAVALIPLFLTYRGWKQLGGPENYVPPLPKGA